MFPIQPDEENFELDEGAPERAKRGNSQSPPPVEQGDDAVVRKDMAMPAGKDAEGDQAPEGGPAEEVVPPQHAGQPFKIEWIKVAPLPFTRIRLLRNPWNQDKEIKVSRDGTEVEPRVAEQLLAEWDALEAERNVEPAAPPVPAEDPRLDE